MKKIVLLVIFSVSVLLIPAQNTELPIVKKVYYQPESRVWFARYGQFQLKFDYIINDTPLSLPQVKEQDLQVEKIKSCMNIALENNINVVIFPELSMSLKKNKRKKLIKYIEKFATEHDMIVIAGTFYDEKGRCKNVNILPGKTIYSYKIRPSIFEASPFYGKGMSFADTLFLFETKYGNFMPLVCVDLISDDANYTVRNLSNKGRIDMLININFNPKSQEFMREASAMTVRHPLFVSLTNICCHGEVKRYTWDDDEYGNTSIFGSVNDFFQTEITKSLPSFYCVSDTINGNVVVKTNPAYKTMLGIINPGEEALLMYDINLRVTRAPQENNAPDQGYPTIKNLKIINLNNKFQTQK